MHFPGLSAAFKIAKNFYLLKHTLKRKDFEDLLEVIQLAKEKELLVNRRADQLTKQVVKAYKLLHKTSRGGKDGPKKRWKQT